MAENTVVKGQLTQGMIDAGAELTAQLDKMGLPIAAAMWFRAADAALNRCACQFLPRPAAQR